MSSRGEVYTPFENSLPCSSSTNDPLPPLPPRPPPSRPCPLPTIGKLRPPPGRARARSTPSPLLYLNPPRNTSQDDSNYVTTPRACDLISLLLLPPLSRFLSLSLSPFLPSSLLFSLSLSLPPRKVSIVLPPSDPRFPRRFSFYPAARACTRDMCGGALYTYIALYSGQHSTKPRGSRQSPLVH